MTTTRTGRALKVLHIVPYYEPAFLYGGPVRSVSTLCKALAQLGAEVTVFTTDADGERSLDVPIGARIDMEGVQVYYYRRERPRGYFRSPGLIQAARDRIKEFDVVHSCALWTYLMYGSSRLCAKAGIPRIDSPRGALMPWDLGQKYWKKWACLQLGGRRQINSAAGIHCTDELEAEGIKKLDLRPPLFVVPNAVNSDVFDNLPLRGSIRSRLGLPTDALVTVFLGRLAAKKGIDLALEAFSLVSEQRRNAYFLIAGPDDGGTGRAMKQLAADRKGGDRVFFLGEVRSEGRRAVLADADLFLLTSHSENFGMAAAEAMAAGVPVLLSDRTGISKSVAAGGAGKVTGLTPLEISSAWTGMLGNLETLRDMGERGRAMVRRDYDPRAVAGRMLDVYEQLAESNRR